MTEELRQNLSEISTTYRRLADWLDALSNLVVSPTETVEQPELPGITEVAETPAPEPQKPTITLEEIRGFLATKSRDGYTAEVKALIREYGVTNLSKVDPEDYEALMEKAEEIGNAG